MYPSSVQNAFYGIREYVTPVLKKSNVLQTGILTPEEFVAAGDFLTYKFPTWSWQVSLKSSMHAFILFREGGLPNQRKPFLPNDRQFLVTRNVPCSKRAIMEDHLLPELLSDDEFVDCKEENKSDWIVAHDKANLLRRSSTNSAASSGFSNKPPEGSIGSASNDDLFMVEPDPARLISNEDLYAEDINLDFKSHVIRTRTYDIFITYDKYYQVPRLWLQGYDESGVPLKPEQVFEDISQEHARKTITMEPHPNLPSVMASIHPCKHANVMKKMMEVLEQEGQTKSNFTVEQYLVLFLKFIASVVPTIEYDYTMPLE